MAPNLQPWITRIDPQPWTGQSHLELPGQGVHKTAFSLAIPVEIP
jgi:hypothetical protein